MPSAPACARGGTALAAPFALDTGHSRGLFAMPHFDISFVRGRFAKVAGSIEFDPQNRTGSVDIRVDPGAVDTGIRALDQILRGGQYLDAAKFGDAHRRERWRCY